MMGIKLLILQFIVFLTVFGQFTTADKLEGIYPDVRKCFIWSERKYEDSAAKMDEYYRNDCKVEIPDENSVCFKYCLLSRREMIWPVASGSAYNYTLHPWSVSGNARRMVGIERSDGGEAKWLEKHVEEVAAKCLESSFIVPKAEVDFYGDRCKSLAPIYQENLGKLIGCLEDVLKEC